MLNARAIAVQGFDYRARAVAVRGFVVVEYSEAMEYAVGGDPRQQLAIRNNHTLLLMVSAFMATGGQQ